MASAVNVIKDWTADGGERHTLYGQVKGLVLRWLNEAQLRFADKSEVLQGIWEPVIDDDGIATLPDDFLREVPDRVQWDDTTSLVKCDYATVKIADPSQTNYYAIWDGKFYVFAASAGEPSIPYIKKPAEILSTQLATAELEIPTECSNDLILFLDAMFQRRKGDVAGYMALLDRFDQKALEYGIRFRGRRNPVPVTRGGMF